jgi:glycosyltransferase involved in cell wall biosynthesis
VVATHARGAALAPLVTARVGDSAESRALTFGAGVALLARRAPGGFPIKLLNYMEAGRAIVARASVADPLVHDRSGWIVAEDAGPSAWSVAIGTLFDDPARAARLGEEARWVLEREHDPVVLAHRLLAAVPTRAPRGAGGAIGAIRR